MKAVRPGRFVSLIFGVLSVLVLAAMVKFWPCISAQDRVPPLFFAAIMVGIAFSAFWHLHNLFARKPFALYEIRRERTARGTVRRVRPGKSMAVLCGGIFALIFIFGGYWTVSYTHLDVYKRQYTAWGPCAPADNGARPPSAPFRR